MMKSRLVSMLVVFVACGVVYLGVPTGISSAQAEQGEADAELKARMERLEKQVADLQKQAEELERRLEDLDVEPVAPIPQDTVPPAGQPFEFNDQTYYLVPLDEAERETNGTRVPKPR